MTEFKITHLVLGFSFYDSHVAVPAEDGQTFELQSVIYIVMAILVGIGVVVFIVLVCYYRRRAKAAAGETSYICLRVSRAYLVSLFYRCCIQNKDD